MYKVMAFCHLQKSLGLNTVKSLLIKELVLKKELKLQQKGLMKVNMASH